MIRNTFLSLIINEFNEFYHIFGVKYNGLNKTTKKIAFFFCRPSSKSGKLVQGNIVKN